MNVIPASGRWNLEVEKSPPGVYSAKPIAAWRVNDDGTLTPMIAQGGVVVPVTRTDITIWRSDL